MCPAGLIPAWLKVGDPQVTPLCPLSWSLLTTINPCPSLSTLLVGAVESLSHVRLCSPVDCSRPGSPSFTISQSLRKLMSIEAVMPSNPLILCRPLLLLPSMFPSIRVFSNESTLCIKWPKYWSFNFSISLSNEYSGLISFTTDWFYLLAVCPRDSSESLLQHHSLKTSILWRSVFFMV